MHKQPLVVADESVDYRIVIQLREIGINVFSIGEDIPSITDIKVLEIANNYEALLITEDKDFGELVFRLNLPHHGILLIRIEDVISKVQNVVVTIQDNLELLHNKFSVLNEKQLRIKQ